MYIYIYIYYIFIYININILYIYIYIYIYICISRKVGHIYMYIRAVLTEGDQLVSSPPI